MILPEDFFLLRLLVAIVLMAASFGLFSELMDEYDRRHPTSRGPR